MLFDTSRENYHCRPGADVAAPAMNARIALVRLAAENED